MASQIARRFATSGHRARRDYVPVVSVRFRRDGLQDAGVARQPLCETYVPLSDTLRSDDTASQPWNYPIAVARLQERGAVADIGDRDPNLL
ncbi:hypothetical protein RE428_05210 [Marinobacter nanhaiticus D15-8W]|uniref:hypothetical protein n=1 Tax=Marinobacter nanhaiticus TaxID=1305740 RepID=UPI0012B670BC|nr:hypothetical protein [Marinobacter nanhaiticus]BES69503.1 hypothetical protein RE428_05210 [Marinobacter nanhaiticus D15-8W]